jgi:alkylation response protein AidB-like acyl-CoA dehydrogenase
MTSSGAAAQSDLLARTKSLLPVLRQKAAATEAARRVPPESYDALAEAGVLRMMAPRRFGGQEASFELQCAVLAEIARACPSTSWVATILSAMSWVVSVFPDEAQQEILGDEDPRISGVFSPTGTAERTSGGFIVTGRWPFNTGCHGARWTVLNAVLAEGDGVPMCVLARSEDLVIQDDWYASGMAGTGSNTIVADEVFVPGYRCQPLPDMVEARYPARHNSANPYFNYPLAPVLSVNAGGTPLGIARGALDAFFERLPGRGITYTTYTNKAEAPITHLQVAEASLTLDSASAHIGLATSILDGNLGRALSLEQRVKARTHVAYATGLARQAVDTLFYGSGASASQSHVPMQRFQRDIQVLANHAIMHPATAIELYGRVLCGLPPNSPLY